MPLDVSTITFAGAIVSLASALLLLLYWMHERSARAALWWAGASSAKGLGIALLAFHAVLPIQSSQNAAPLILNSSALLTLIAARIFVRGTVRIWPILLGCGSWLLLLAVTSAYASGQVVGALSGTLSGGAYAATAMGLWRSRDEHLRARLPMIALLSV